MEVLKQVDLIQRQHLIFAGKMERPFTGQACILGSGQCAYRGLRLCSGLS